ncbi:MAG: tryptophan halogenase family protein [Sandaracinobacteroides sp.]
MTGRRGGEENSVRRLVVVGGGTAGWMAAAAFARFLESGWSVTLVESEAIGTVGVGEATIPQLRLFNSALGIDEDAFLAQTQGTIKLGIEFVDWRRQGDRYMHGFGVVGRDLGLVQFHHYWLRARSLGLADALGSYCPNVVAALADRFERDSGPASIARQPMPHAFHFDAGLYAGFLRRYAEARGVARHEGRILDVELSGGGDVAALRMEGGRRIEGDLFIDCSGFRGLVIGEALGVGYQDWSRWLPCDRALAVPCEGVRPITPYTRSTAHSAGWQWRIPLQHRTGNGLVYCSAHLSDDEAAVRLLANLDGKALAEPRPLTFTTGRREVFWHRNCVAVGLASGFLEPLESTSIHMVQSAIERILGFLPAGAPDERAIAEYNRQTAFEMECIRDFIILHYKATERRDSAFWRDCAAMQVPESLKERIDLFREAGRIFRNGSELFTEVGWVQVLLGQGVLPEGWHPLAEQLTVAELGEFLELQAQTCRDRARRMSGHDQFLAANCAATDARAQEKRA